MDVTVGKALKYTLLPGVLPRSMGLFFSGFHYIALFMAYAYNAVRLLPDNHPYLRHENMGRFGVRHVMTESANNLVFDRNHIDQVLLYFLLLVGIVILMLQMLLFAFAMAIPGANASSSIDSILTAGNFFDYATRFIKTPDPVDDDLAFMLLDYTFGVEGRGGDAGFFNSCVAQRIPCLDADPAAVRPEFPSPMHSAYHTLVEFYNTGLLAIGFLILMYFIFVVTVETAQTGMPFGRRFNRLWVPLRLIFAVALLFPLASANNFNIIQVITLTAAKWGSGLATNGWNLFLHDVQKGWEVPVVGLPVGSGADTPMGDTESLVATPNTPDLNTLIEFIFVAKTCMHAEKRMFDRDIDVYMVRLSPNDSDGVPDPSKPVVRGFMGTSYGDALDYYQNRNFSIVFGELDPRVSVGANASAKPLFYKTTDFLGYVRPLCGEISFTVTDVNSPGALAVQQAYYQLVKDLWNHGATNTFARNVTLRTLPLPDKDPLAPLPDKGYIQSMINLFDAQAEAAVKNGVDAAIADGRWVDMISGLGWAGAALWYNKIAELNGSVYSSVHSIPTPGAYPEVMEEIKEQQLQTTDSVDPQTQFSAYLGDSRVVDYRDPGYKYVAMALYQAQAVWFDSSDHEVGDNWFHNVISFIFGLDGLYNMYDNPDIHPLAQLVGIGRSLMESTITMFATSIGSGLLSKGMSVAGFDNASQVFGLRR